MLKKTITIDDDQGKWLDKYHINLSKLVRDLLKKEIERLK